MSASSRVDTGSRMGDYEVEQLDDGSDEIQVYRVESDGAKTPIYRGPDRRQRPTPRLSRYSFMGGRRWEIRREGEVEGAFVDLYGGRLWMALLWVALLNVADSYFTLVHLQAGGVELNPVADALLHSGRLGFVVWKSLLIGIALLVLCIHKNFFLAKAGLMFSASAYTVLLLYHLSLFY